MACSARCIATATPAGSRPTPGNWRNGCCVRRRRPSAPSHGRGGAGRTCAGSPCKPWSGTWSASCARRRRWRGCELHWFPTPYGRRPKRRFFDSAPAQNDSKDGALSLNTNGPGLAGRAPVARSPRGKFGPESASRTQRDHVKPTGHGLPLSEGARLPGQHQHGGLEGILRVIRIGQYPPADPQHHRPVPADQLLEGRLVLLRGEPLQ